MIEHTDTCEAFWRAGRTYGPCICGAFKGYAASAELQKQDMALKGKRDGV